MQRHARKHDPGSRTFHCSVAGCPYATEKAFYRRDKLVSHRRTVHQIESNFPLSVREWNVGSSDCTLSAEAFGTNNVVATGNNPQTSGGFPSPNLPAEIHNVDRQSAPTDAILEDQIFPAGGFLYPSFPTQYGHMEYLNVSGYTISGNPSLPGTELETPGTVMAPEEQSALDSGNSSFLFLNMD